MLTSTQTREKRHTYNIHGSSLTELTKSESLARKWAKQESKSSFFFPAVLLLQRRGRSVKYFGRRKNRGVAFLPLFTDTVC